MSGQHGGGTSGDKQVHQHNFIRVFIGVMVALTIFTFVCIAIARILDPGADPSSDSILRAQLEQRIAPVGSVITSADQLDQPIAVVTSDAAPKTGGELVTANCAACHVTGVAGAPKLDDDAEWSKRRSAGLDALVASVVNGKGSMPPRAGTQLTDDQILLAVQHIAGFEVEESAPVEKAADTAAETAADTAAGSVAGLTESIKGVADTVCTACHLSGVGNAPKLGDKEAWAARAEKGLEGMIKVVATGKNAMPPRGGSSLTDEELGVAIEYLISK